MVQDVKELDLLDSVIENTEDALLRMVLTQLRLQVKAYGHSPATMVEGERMAYVRDNVLACTDELHEAMAETGWKPWATSNHMKHEAYVHELVDAWHFFMNLLLSAVDPEGPYPTVHSVVEAFTAHYDSKWQRNAERQREGYDGVSGKCPACRRSYDDVTVACTPAGYEGQTLPWCDDQGRFVAQSRFVPPRGT